MPAKLQSDTLTSDDDVQRSWPEQVSAYAIAFYVYDAYVFNGSRSWLQNCGTTRSQLLGAIYASNEMMHDLSTF